MNTGNEKSTQYRWVILAVVFAAYALNFCDRANISIALPVLRKEFNLSNTELGAIASMFFVGYIVAMLPSGFAVSRFGSRGLLAWSIFGFSAFTFLIGTAGSTAQILWYRFGLGACESPVTVGGAALTKAWFPKHEQARASSIFSASGPFGAILVPPVGVWLLTTWDWHAMFFAFAIPGFVLMLVWYWLVRNRPDDMARCNELEREYIKEQRAIDLAPSTLEPTALVRLVDRIVVRKKVTPVEEFWPVFYNRNTLGVAVGFLTIGVVLWGCVAWIPSYLVDAKQFTMAKMGWVATAPWIGGFVGCLVGGYISDVLLQKRRKFNLLFSPFILVIALVLLINVPDNVYVLSLLFGLLGLFIFSAWGCYFSYPMLVTTAKTYPVAISYMLWLGAFSGFISPVIAGYILDVTGRNYNMVFGFFVACAALNFLVNAFMLQEPAEAPAAKAS
jgi:sugar phosphate permease